MTPAAGECDTSPVPDWDDRQLIYRLFGADLDRILDGFLEAAAEDLPGLTDPVTGDCQDPGFGQLVDLVDRVFWYALTEAALTPAGRDIGMARRRLARRV